MKLFRWTRDLAGEGIRSGDERVLPDQVAEAQVAAGNGEICPSIYDDRPKADAPGRLRRHYLTRKV